MYLVPKRENGLEIANLLLTDTESEKTPLQRPGNLLKDVRKTLHYPQKGKTSCAASACSLQNLEDPGIVYPFILL